MADITIVKRNAYSGLDADKPAAANVGDTYDATDTAIKYFWNGSSWKNFTQVQFVPRPATTNDFVVGDFTTDGSAKVDGLDLSPIVPDGAIAVQLLLILGDNLVDSWFSISQNAVNVNNRFRNSSSVANVLFYSLGQINIDSDRKLDYIGANVTFTTLSVTVLGWWI